MQCTFMYMYKCINYCDFYRYSNGDVYSGHWSHDLRAGFGRLEESSRKGSCYIGAWANNKKNGYGIYEDKMR